MVVPAHTVPRELNLSPYSVSLIIDTISDIVRRRHMHVLLLWTSTHATTHWPNVAPRLAN